MMFGHVWTTFTTFCVILESTCWPSVSVARKDPMGWFRIFHLHRSCPCPWHIGKALVHQELSDMFARSLVAERGWTQSASGTHWSLPLAIPRSMKYLSTSSDVNQSLGGLEFFVCLCQGATCQVMRIEEGCEASVNFAVLSMAVVCGCTIKKNQLCGRSCVNCLPACFPMSKGKRKAFPALATGRIIVERKIWKHDLS